MTGNKRAATIIAILLTVAMALSVAGCGQTKPSTSVQPSGTAQPSADATTQAPPAQKVELVMGHPFAAQHPISQNILIPLAEELSEKSNGRITLTIHAGGAVTSAATVREDVASGAIDIGWTLQGYTPGKYPLTDAIELPFIFDSLDQASYTLWNVFQQSPDMQKEYGDVKVLGLWCTDSGELLTKKLVEHPEDLKGMNIRFSGQSIESAIKMFGGNPVGLPMPQVYDALERGILDGVAVGPSTIESYKLNEIITHTTHGLKYFYSTQVIFMNKDKWDSLSKEDQDLLASLTGQVTYEKATALYDASYEKGLEMAKASNVTITEISPELRAQWKEKTSSVVDKWLADTSAKGLPAQDLLDLIQKIAKEYKPK